MRVRIPDGLIYAALVVGLMTAAQAWRGRADAPSAPPPVPGLGQTPIAPGSPFAADRVLAATPEAGAAVGTAFSVGDGGLWLTARHVVEGCGRIGVVVAEGRGVAARIAARQGDLALLRTDGGAPALPLATTAALRPSEQGFHPGFPKGLPGEAASRLLGPQTLPAHGRGITAAPVLAWAETGRTEGLDGSLAGLSGAPVLDGDGRVVGVTLAEAPRRGRIYSSTPQAMRALLAAAKLAPSPAVAAPISVESYGRAADGLRRDLRVVELVCLAA